MQEPTSNDVYTNVEINANGDLNGFEGEYDVRSMCDWCVRAKKATLSL